METLADMRSGGKKVNPTRVEEYRKGGDTGGHAMRTVGIWWRDGEGKVNVESRSREKDRR